MKIELKNIQHSPSLSRETEAFTANLYINDVHAGFTENHGHGGNTNYTAKNDEGRKLIADAEQYCKGLPPKEYESFGDKHTLNVDLESFIDDLLYNHLSLKEQARFNKKIEKQTENGVVFGIPGQSFSAIVYKIPLRTLLAQPTGTENLKKNIINTVLPELKDGKMILNTNIPEKILKEAGLKEDQYVKPIQEELQIQVKKAGKRI